MDIYFVYIIYSSRLKRYYIGSTDNFTKRLEEHNNKTYGDGFTHRGVPWEEYLSIENLPSAVAYEIERHIKSMKSTKYVENLKKYPEMVQKLRERFGSPVQPR